MSKCICTLEPKAIWENFYKLTQVPRPSNHEEKAREFVMNWAKENGIHAEMDEANNILLSKPATPGMENRKGVILQGHLDMVPQKNEDKQHDFTKDPIEAYIDGEWVPLLEQTTVLVLPLEWLFYYQKIFLTARLKC